MGLREKPRLDMPGQLQFLACAVFGFRPFGMDAALCFDFAIDGVITQKRKGVSVRVFEGGGNSAPELHLRRLAKTFSVRKMICVGRPISWYSAEPACGAMSESTAVPSGGVTAREFSADGT